MSKPVFLQTKATTDTVELHCQIDSVTKLASLLIHRDVVRAFHYLLILKLFSAGLFSNR